MKELTPQVSHVAKILLDYGKHSPGDVPAVSVHFDSMRDNWKDKMQTLTTLVDSATDTGKFIEACGMSLFFFFITKCEWQKFVYSSVKTTYVNHVACKGKRVCCPHAKWKAFAED